MTPQKIKNSLLWMAVQGKLSIQNHNETIIFDSDAWDINGEENFTIPENWVWKRFGFFGDLRMGKTILKSDLSDKGIPVYSATQNDDVLGYIKHAELELHKNDLVIPARGNSIGYVTLVRDEIATCTQTTICVRDIHDICPEYLYWCCYAFKDKWFVFSGSAIPQVTVKQISQFMVPTPPLAEQKRIVAKIEELLPYIDRYEAAWSKLEDFNKRFPVDMQKSILQMAIQGKLVEQRPEEGTGEELYQQIQAEKQRLIKAGTIKKEKSLPEITDDEVPFDIPESWKWVRFNNVCAVLTCGYASTPTYVSKENGMPFISAKNVKPYRFMPEDHNYISRELYNKLTQNAKPEKGDILLTRVGAGIGEAAIIDTDLDFAIYVSLTLIKLVDNTLIDNKYVLYWLNSPIGVSSAKKNIYGKNASQGNLNVKNVRDFLVPLPPLAEQKRIVAKLEEILPLCEQLK